MDKKQNYMVAAKLTKSTLKCLGKIILCINIVLYQLSWLIKWLVTQGFYKYSPKIRGYCLTNQAACTDAILIEGFLFLILWSMTYNEMDKARKMVLLFNCFSIAGLGIISFFLHPFN